MTAPVREPRLRLSHVLGFGSVVLILGGCAASEFDTTETAHADANASEVGTTSTSAAHIFPKDNVMPESNLFLAFGKSLTKTIDEFKETLKLHDIVVDEAVFDESKCPTLGIAHYNTAFKDERNLFIGEMNQATTLGAQISHAKEDDPLLAGYQADFDNHTEAAGRHLQRMKDINQELRDALVTYHDEIKKSCA